MFLAKQGLGGTCRPRCLGRSGQTTLEAPVGWGAALLDVACPAPEARRRQPHMRPRARVLPHLQQEQRGRMLELVPDQNRQPCKKTP